MNKKKELLVQIMWELAGSIFYAIGIYNFALQAEFPMTGYSGCDTWRKIIGREIFCQLNTMHAFVFFYC